jgi:hypothetical protein
MMHFALSRKDRLPAASDLSSLFDENNIILLHWSKYNDVLQVIL